jgi:orotidine-5'-phosphate decarboxylase
LFVTTLSENQNEKFAQKLETRVETVGNSVCFGMDPVLKLMPLDGAPEEVVLRYYMEILEEMDKRQIFPAVVKPNSAYYEQISVEALNVLQRLNKACQDLGMLVILDAKRGDIGKSSLAYAEAAFNTYSADCITASPYMGGDSVGPFLNHPAQRGVYALLRTSNPGAADIEDVMLADGRKLFYHVADKLMEWDNGSLGAVVGATKPEELEEITRYFTSKGHEIPFLIPGVSIPGVPGQQGGDATTVLKALKSGGSERNFHVLNSSSGLNFAWQAKEEPSRFAMHCVDALARLNDEIASF